MERLVKRVGNEHAVPTEIDMDFVCALDKNTFDGLQRIFDQLCDLTDILGDDYDLDRLRELVEEVWGDCNLSYDDKVKRLDSMSMAYVDYIVRAHRLANQKRRTNNNG